MKPSLSDQCGRRQQALILSVRSEPDRYTSSSKRAETAS